MKNEKAKESGNQAAKISGSKQWRHGEMAKIMAMAAWHNGENNRQ